MMQVEIIINTVLQLLKGSFSAETLYWYGF